MRGCKAKQLRRFAWTLRRNPRNKQMTYRQIKQKYSKGIPLGIYIYYPREGRNVNRLLYGPC